MFVYLLWSCATHISADQISCLIKSFFYESVGLSSYRPKHDFMNARLRHISEVRGTQHVAG